jgi:hypothetical protein
MVEKREKERRPCNPEVANDAATVEERNTTSALDARTLKDSTTLPSL